jgi:hypothetical protein
LVHTSSAAEKLHRGHAANPLRIKSPGLKATSSLGRFEAGWANLGRARHIPDYCALVVEAESERS